TDAVGEPAARELEQTGRGFGDPFDDAEKRGTGTEYGGQEEGQERIDHLARRVGQQRHDAEPEDVAGQDTGVRARIIRARLRSAPGCWFLRVAHALLMLRSVESARSTSASEL